MKNKHETNKFTKTGCGKFMYIGGHPCKRKYYCGDKVDVVDNIIKDVSHKEVLLCEDCKKTGA